MSHIDQAAVIVSKSKSSDNYYDYNLREIELGDVFSICGKVKSINRRHKPWALFIIFETHSAANTALMLNGCKLGLYTYTVTSEVEHTDYHDAGEHHFHIEQSDKPRAGIAAECLANDYELSDDILQRAIEIDNKGGISKKFLSFISDLNKLVGQSAFGPDQAASGKVPSTSKEAHTRPISFFKQKAYSEIPLEYYVNALASPLGHSVLSFYTSTSKQVCDIREEATRIEKYMDMPTPTSSPASASK